MCKLILSCLFCFKVSKFMYVQALRHCLIDGEMVVSERIEALNFIRELMGFDCFAIRYKKVMKLGGFSCQTFMFIIILMNYVRIFAYFLFVSCSF